MIAARLRDYLKQHETRFRALSHPHTASSMQTAEMAHVPGARLAKAVILEDASGPVMAVIPADALLELERLNHDLHRDLAFAEEEELAILFPDCEPGAVPPIGPAYGISTIWDTHLGDNKVVYMEAGDHETLLEISGKAFHELMVPAERGRFTHHI